MNEFLEIAKQTSVPIPTLELLALLVMLTISLVFKATRVGLLVAYLFVFRWGWLFIHETFGVKHDTFMISYLVFGAFVTALSVVMMIRSSD
jgi:hypothetical protein